jgi:hypothetical protein
MALAGLLQCDDALFVSKHVSGLHRYATQQQLQQPLLQPVQECAVAVLSTVAKVQMVTANPVDALAFSGSSSLLSPQPVVRLLDANGVGIAGKSIRPSLWLRDNRNNGVAMAATDSSVGYNTAAVTDADGYARFSDLMVTGARPLGLLGSAYYIRFEADGALTPTNSSLAFFFTEFPFSSGDQTTKCGTVHLKTSSSATYDGTFAEQLQGHRAFAGASPAAIVSNCSGGIGGSGCFIPDIELELFNRLGTALSSDSLAVRAVRVTVHTLQRGAAGGGLLESAIHARAAASSTFGAFGGAGASTASFAFSSPSPVTASTTVSTSTASASSRAAATAVNATAAAAAAAARAGWSLALASIEPATPLRMDGTSSHVTVLETGSGRDGTAGSSRVLLSGLRVMGYSGTFFMRFEVGNWGDLYGDCRASSRRQTELRDGEVECSTTRGRAGVRKLEAAAAFSGEGSVECTTAEAALAAELRPEVRAVEWLGFNGTAASVFSPVPLSASASSAGSGRAYTVGGQVRVRVLGAISISSTAAVAGVRVRLFVRHADACFDGAYAATPYTNTSAWAAYRRLRVLSLPSRAGTQTYLDVAPPLWPTQATAEVGAAAASGGLADVPPPSGPVDGRFDGLGLSSDGGAAEAVTGTDGVAVFDGLTFSPALSGLVSLVAEADGVWSGDGGGGQSPAVLLTTAVSQLELLQQPVKHISPVGSALVSGYTDVRVLDVVGAPVANQWVAVRVAPEGAGGAYLHPLAEPAGVSAAHAAAAADARAQLAQPAASAAAAGSAAHGVVVSALSDIDGIARFPAIAFAAVEGSSCHSLLFTHVSAGSGTAPVGTGTEASSSAASIRSDAVFCPASDIWADRPLSILSPSGSPWISRGVPFADDVSVVVNRLPVCSSAPSACGDDRPISGRLVVASIAALPASFPGFGAALRATSRVAYTDFDGIATFKGLMIVSGPPGSFGIDFTVEGFRMSASMKALVSTASSAATSSVTTTDSSSAAVVSSGGTASAALTTGTGMLTVRLTDEAGQVGIIDGPPIIGFVVRELAALPPKVLVSSATGDALAGAEVTAVLVRDCATCSDVAGSRAVLEEKGAVARTGSDGQATFHRLLFAKATAGYYAMKFRAASGAESRTSVTFYVSNHVSAVNIVTQPAVNDMISGKSGLYALIGQPFSTQPLIQLITDGTAGSLGGKQIHVEVVIAAGTGTGGVDAKVQHSTVVTNHNGLAQFTDLAFSSVQGSNVEVSLVFVVDGVPSSDSGAMTRSGNSGGNGTKTTAAETTETNYIKVHNPNSADLSSLGSYDKIAIGGVLMVPLFAVNANHKRWWVQTAFWVSIGSVVVVTALIFHQGLLASFDTFYNHNPLTDVLIGTQEAIVYTLLVVWWSVVAAKVFLHPAMGTAAEPTAPGVVNACHRANGAKPVSQRASWMREPVQPSPRRPGKKSTKKSTKVPSASTPVQEDASAAAAATDASAAFASGQPAGSGNKGRLVIGLKMALYRLANTLRLSYPSKRIFSYRAYVRDKLLQPQPKGQWALSPLEAARRLVEEAAARRVGGGPAEVEMNVLSLAVIGKQAWKDDGGQAQARSFVTTDTDAAGDASAASIAGGARARAGHRGSNRTRCCFNCCRGCFQAVFQAVYGVVKICAKILAEWAHNLNPMDTTLLFPQRLLVGIIISLLCVLLSMLLAHAFALLTVASLEASRQDALAAVASVQSFDASMNYGVEVANAVLDNTANSSNSTGSLGFNGSAYLPGSSKHVPPSTFNASAYYLMHASDAFNSSAFFPVDSIWANLTTANLTTVGTFNQTASQAAAADVATFADTRDPGSLSMPSWFSPPNSSSNGTDTRPEPSLRNESAVSSVNIAGLIEIGPETLLEWQVSLEGASEVAVTMTSLLLLFVAVSMCSRYNRSMRLMRRGEYGHFGPPPSATHEKFTLLGASNFIGYQVTHFIVVSFCMWFFLTLVMFFIISDSARDAALDTLLVVVLGALGASFILKTAGKLVGMCYIVQEGSVQHRRAYLAFDFAFFFLSVINGFFLALFRLFFSIVMVFYFYCRLDHPATGIATAHFDPGHSSYVSMLLLDHVTNNPVMLVFVDLVNERLCQRAHAAEAAVGTGVDATDIEDGGSGGGGGGSGGGSTQDAVRRHAIRFRWALWLTLANNRSLLLLRKRARNINGTVPFELLRNGSGLLPPGTDRRAQV